MKRLLPILSLPLFLLAILLLLQAYPTFAFSTQWSTPFDGSTGSNPDLPDWSEHLIGDCSGQDHRLSGGLLQMRAADETSCFGAYYRDNAAFPGAFPTDQDVRVMWRFRYDALRWMGTQAGQVTGRYGSPQYYGLSGVDSSEADYYHVESNGPWGSWNVDRPMWTSSSEDVWRVATFDFLCDGQQLAWWMDGNRFHQVTNGPVLAAGDPSRPYQLWFGNLIDGGGTRGWTAFDVDYAYVYTVERPQLNTPTPGSGGTQAVAWEAVPNTTQPDGSTWGIAYQVRVCTDPTCAGVVQTSAWQASTSYTFTGLPLNQTYHFQVRAKWVGVPELVTCWGNTVTAAMSGSPALALAKGATSQVEPGQSIDYTLTVQNTGAGPATGVIIRDPIPDYITNPSNISSGGQVQGSEIVWQIGILQAGESRSLSWQGTVDPAIPDNVSRVTNRASASDDDGDQTQAQAETTVIRPGVSLVKTAPTQAAPGDKIPFDLTVANSGDVALSGLILRDPIPSGIINPTDISDGGQLQSSEIVWQIGTLQPGQSRTVSWQGTIDPSLTDPGVQVVNTATVCDSADRCATATTITSLFQADVDFDKEATPYGWPGSDIAYTLTLRNTSQVELTNVVIRDPLPQGIYYPRQISHAGQAVISPFEGEIEIVWRLPTLAPGQEVVLSWLGTVDPELPESDNAIRNLASVSSDEGLYREAEASTYILHQGLTLAKTATPQVGPGEIVQYELTVHNPTDAQLFEVAIEDQIPENIANPDGISNGGQVQAETITWQIGALEPGQSRTVTWQGTVDPTIPAGETEIVNTATAWDMTGREVQAEAVTHLFDQAVRLLKDAAYAVAPGGVITYALTVENPGLATLYDLEVRDPVPNYVLNLTPTTPGGSFAGNQEIVWQLDRLDPGQRVVLTWGRTVDPAIPVSRSTIFNEATVTTASGLVEQASAQSRVVRPGLILRKEATVLAGPGETIDYTLIVENPGPAPLYAVEVVDPLPEYILNPLDLSGGAQLGAEALTWQLPLLDLGERVTLHWQGTVDPLVPAEVTATAGDLEAEAQAVTDLNFQNLYLTKDATCVVFPGQPITYALTVENPGPATLYDIEVRDPVPAEVQNPNAISHGGLFAGNQEIAWQLDRLDPGQVVVLTWQGVIDPDVSPVTTVIFNEATAVTGSGLDREATAKSYLGYPDLILTKEATLVAGPGDPVTYTLTVHNPTDAPLYEVEVLDPFPGHLIDPRDLSGSAEIRAETIAWLVGMLASNESRVLRWTATVDPNLPASVSQLVNVVQATAAGGLSDEAQAVTNLHPQGLTLRKEAPYTTWPGQVITYLLRLENTRQSTLYDIEVRDPVPQFDLYPSAISHGGYLEGNTTVVWQLDRLEPNQIIELTWQATVPPDTPRSIRLLRNEATVTTPGGLEEEASVVSYLAFPELRLYKG